MAQLPSPVSVGEALRVDGHDIRVPDGGSLTIGPFERSSSGAFRLAEISTFADLHRIGFLSTDLPEQDVLQAFRADDRVYREAVLRRRTSEPDASCSCDGHHRAAPTFSRRHVQNNLIDVLQAHSRASLAADDLTVLHTYGRVKAWLNRPPRYLVGVVVANDIMIGDNATLTMTPTVESLHANEITIGGNGHLSFAGTSIAVKCHVLNGPSKFSSQSLMIDKYVKGLARERVRGVQ
jgi:hypothetical protein